MTFVLVSFCRCLFVVCVAFVVVVVVVVTFVTSGVVVNMGLSMCCS